MSFIVEFEGLDELVALGDAEADEFKIDLQRAVVEAAQDGVDAAKGHHEYTDRTGTLTGTSEGRIASSGADDTVAAEMVFPTPYASFVDAGTTRARAYPFTPTAEIAATFSLNEEAVRALEAFADRMNRG